MVVLVFVFCVELFVVGVWFYGCYYSRLLMMMIVMVLSSSVWCGCCVVVGVGFFEGGVGFCLLFIVFC